MCWAIQGFFRGLLAQAVGLVGTILGFWAGFVIKHWLGGQWAGAQPAVFFWALTWLVTLLGALAILSLFQVGAERLGRALREGPWGGLDRWTGLAAGAALGIVVSSLFVLGTIRMTLPRWVGDEALHARTTRPLLTLGAETCRRASDVPGSTRLRREYLVALRRLERRTPSI